MSQEVNRERTADQSSSHGMDRSQTEGVTVASPTRSCKPCQEGKQLANDHSRKEKEIGRPSEAREPGDDVTEQNKTIESQSDFPPSPESNRDQSETVCDQPNSGTDYSNDIDNTDDMQMQEEQETNGKSPENAEVLYAKQDESEIVTSAQSPEENSGRNSNPATDSPVKDNSSTDNYSAASSPVKEPTSSPEIMPRNSDDEERQSRTSSPEQKDKGFRSPEQTTEGFTSPDESYSRETNVTSSEQKATSPDPRETSPDQEANSPEQRVKSPEERGEEGMKSPEESVKSPEERVQSPEERMKSSEESVISHEERVKSPEQRMESPENSVKSPDERVKSPEERIRSPDIKARSAESKTTSAIHSPNKPTNHSKIETLTQSVTDIKNNLQDIFMNAGDLLQAHNKKLNSEPLKDFALGLDDFRKDFASLNDAYSECEDMSKIITAELKCLRQTTNDISNLLNRKFRDEDLSQWIDYDPNAESKKDQLREERIAHEKAAHAKASQIRADAAKAAVGVAEANQLAIQAEAEATEAELAAKTARELADDAMRVAEEARVAAEEKRRVEEEAKRKAEEKARQKAEEEQRKREEEERRLVEEAKRKGTSIESERQREEQERRQREAERKNPKNWPRYIYSTDGSDFDPGVGCIIRAITGSVARYDIEANSIDQLSGVLQLQGNEELISNIIKVTPVDSEKTFSFEEPFCLALPHCAPRSGIGKEPVIKTLNAEGRWVELRTYDAYFEDIKEMRFVETRTKTFGTFVVVYRTKRDTLTLPYKGGKVTSSVDSRVSFTSKSSRKKINTNITIEVQHVDQGIVQDLRNRKPAECAALVTCSPILNLKVHNKIFQNPVTVGLPVPQNPLRIKRPMTSLVRMKQGSEPNGRPQTAKPTPYNKDEGEEATDELHLLTLCDGEWAANPDTPLTQSKNKDIVMFEMVQPLQRFLIIRTRLDSTPVQLEKLPPLIDEAVTQRVIKVFLRQPQNDLQNVYLSCANVNKVERVLRQLAEEGFDDGPPPSNDLLVTEGQVMKINFRGNIRLDDPNYVTKSTNPETDKTNPETDSVNKTSNREADNSMKTIVYNTHISSKVNFRVVELDKFAQKGIECYRGFAQVFTKGLVPSVNSVDDRDKSRGSTQQYKAPVVDILPGYVLVCELLVSIPKPEPEPPKPLNTAPVLLKVEGPVNNDVLWHIADEIGEDWVRLAQYLCVKRVRMQAIMRQHVNDDNTKKIYDMLTTWSKRLPTSIDRVDMLSHALTLCGRGDLAAELQDRREEFRRQRAYSARGSYLHKAFVRIAREPRVTRNWRVLGRRLGLSEAELGEIERMKQTNTDRCYYILQRWRENQGDDVTLTVLSDKLRQARYRGLAREIQTVT